MDINSIQTDIEQDKPSSNEIQLEALKVLINGIKTAQKRGAYELPEAEILWNAIKVFMMDEQNEAREHNNRSLNVDFRNDL
jgi:hypothetical protein